MIEMGGNLYKPKESCSSAFSRKSNATSTSHSWRDKGRPMASDNGRGKKAVVSPHGNDVCGDQGYDEWRKQSLLSHTESKRSINKLSPQRENIAQGKYALRNSPVMAPQATADLRRDENGYEVLEYVVERVDRRLLAVFKLPMVAIILIVISWSFSVISAFYTIFTVITLVLIAYLHAWNTIVEETLIVTRTLGIQVQQTNILGRLKFAKYVPIENIKAVVINEIIRRQRVISYLLIVLEVAESTGKIMVPLMTGTLPRLRTIEQIYQHIQKVIF